MGCSDSKQELPLPTIIKKKDNLPLPSWLRSQVIVSLRKNDCYLIRRVFKENSVNPGFGLYQDNPSWNCFHECCRRNSPEALDLLIDFANFLEPSRLKQMINQKDKDGDTPAIVCCMYNSYQNLELLLKRNLVNLKETNNNGHNAEQIASDFSDRCLEVIREHAFYHEKSQGSPKSSEKYIQSPSTQSTFRMVPITQSQTSQRQTSAHKFDKMTHLLSQVNENFKIYTVLSEMANQTETFVDKEFSTDLKAIAIDENQINLTLSKTQWLRPHELYQGKFPFVKLFDRIVPEDIDLTTVEDSSLGLALQVLSEFPSKITQTIINKGATIHGIYSCKFHVMGLTAEVCTDDLLPCNEDGKLLFINSKCGEIWPMVMEKLAAKFYGCYQHTQDGLLDDVFEDLLGVPCSNYDLKKYQKETIFDLLSSFAKLNFIMAASSISDKKGSKGSLKVKDGHYIVDAYEKGGNKYIQLRAPNGVFKGEKIEEKTSQNGKLLQVFPQEHTFAIKAEDFVEFFDIVSVAFHHDAWNRNYINMNCWNNHAEYVSLSVKRPTRIYIVVNQESARLSDDADYQYSEVEILLAKKTESSFKKIGIFPCDSSIIMNLLAAGDKGAFYPGKSLHVDQRKLIELETGDYVIRVKLPCKSKEQRAFTITTYSEEEVYLDYLPRENYKNFLELVYLEEARNASDKYELGKQSVFANGWEGNHLWLYMQNNSSEKTWNLVIQFKKMENVILMKRYRADDVLFNCSLPPNSERVAILKRRGHQKAVINWAFTNNWI